MPIFPTKPDDVGNVDNIDNIDSPAVKRDDIGIPTSILYAFAYIVIMRAEGFGPFAMLCIVSLSFGILYTYLHLLDCSSDAGCSV